MNLLRAALVPALAVVLAITSGAIIIELAGLNAFEAYGAAMPSDCVFLVDPRDTLEGVRRAVTVARDLRERGHGMLGIRLDSGDLAALSIKAREILDEGGFRSE